MSDRPEITRASDDQAADRPFPARIARSTSQRHASSEGSPHSSKFRLITGTLLGIGLAALAVAVALASTTNSNVPSAPWSSWSPTSSGRQAASEIAQRVAPEYRLTPGQQLDVVTLVNLANPNTQSTGTSSGLTVAIGTGASGSASSLSLLGGSTLAYNLCGTSTASNCQLSGTPSTARMLLLRREALELALYTFRYVSGVSNVICILPPGHSQTASVLSSHLPSSKTPPSSPLVTTAVLFQRQELAPWLHQPLSSTLQPYPPPIAELPIWEKTAEADVVDQITGHGLFSEQIESEQTGGRLLVLNQLPPS